VYYLYAVRIHLSGTCPWIKPHRGIRWGTCDEKSPFRQEEQRAVSGMKTMARSNYEIMRDQMRGEFVKYDQRKMVEKFHLAYDESYLYINFVSRPNRINRRSGVVEWSEDGFVTAHEADYNASMTIYDVLCYSKDDCKLSGKYCPVNMLKGTIKSFTGGGNFFQRDADFFRGRLEELRRACSRLGQPVNLNGDAAFLLYPFSFLPITLQYWEADDEFPANLKFMFDENIQGYMHFETTFFMVSHLLSRIREFVESEG